MKNRKCLKISFTYRFAPLLLYDPAPVNLGSAYSRSYQSLCNGNNPAIASDIVDNRIWDGIVVFEKGDYLSTISWPGT